MGRQYGGLVGVDLRNFHDEIMADMKARGFSENIAEDIRNSGWARVDLATLFD